MILKEQRDTGSTTGRALRGLAAALALLASPAVTLAAAVETEAPPDVREVSATAAEIDAARARARTELDELGTQIVVTAETAARLGSEIEDFAEDRDAIRTALIEAADAQKRASAEIAASETEIAGLRLQEKDVEASLFERRGTLADVLGALERMGRKPPPAILVHPDDALGSVRSAILLGSVVPTIRSETDSLSADLRRLSDLRTDIETQRRSFADSLRRQREEELRLSLLFQEKERLEADRRRTLEEMNRRTAELAGRATTLEELIGSLEADLAKAAAAEEEARRVAAARAAEAEERRLATLEAEREAREVAKADAAGDEGGRRTDPEAPPVETAVLTVPDGPDARATYDVASLRRDMAELDVSAPFSTLEGSLVRPVVGEVRRGFGEDDGFGRRSEGTTFTSRAGDLVTAPADGRILYSGPFRSYGQLLILNAGDGYHIVLAGMREIDVAVGQFVLAGEPVGVMGARRLASIGSDDLPSTEPSLYVEFRKNGKPVDPDPWWTDGASGRTRNDS